MGYYPSRFNVVVALPKTEPDAPEMFSILNTFTSSSIDVDEQGRRFIFKEIRERTNFTPEEESTVSDLVEMGFLLPDTVNEQEEFSKWFKRKVVEDNTLLSCTVFTNFTCNLACPYCFQEGFHNGLFMRKDTALQTCEWLQGRMERHNIGKLEIVFCGGEPMLNPDAIRFFSKQMSERCRALGAKFESRLVTNGVLLTPEIIDELKTNGLIEVKVTVDGDRTAHDQKRIFKGGKGTYDIIMQRLEAIAGRGVTINLGGNFDKTNKHSIPNFLKDLEKRPFRNDIGVVFFKPILSTHESVKEPSCAVCSFSDTDMDDLIDVHRWVREAGFQSTDPMDMGPCDYYRRHSYTIDAKGKIYQCPVFVGVDKYARGDVWKDFYDEQFHAVEPMKEEACQTCAYTPYCAGGCRYGSTLKGGSHTDINCEKRYFNKVRKSLIWRHDAIDGKEGIVQ